MIAFSIIRSYYSYVLILLERITQDINHEIGKDMVIPAVFTGVQNNNRIKTTMTFNG